MGRGGLESKLKKTENRRLDLISSRVAKITTRSPPPEMHFVDLFANVSWQVKAISEMTNCSGE